MTVKPICAVVTLGAERWGMHVRRPRIAAVMSITGILLASAGLVWLGTRKPPASPEAILAEAAQPGMQLLHQYRCHRSETKRIFLRGIEDDFSPQGDEPASLRPELRSERTASLDLSAYDDSEADRVLIDHVTLPSDVARGLFVVSLRPSAGSGNDAVAIGDLTWEREVPPRPWGFGASVPTLAEQPGWQSVGPVHYAEFRDLRFERESATPLKGRFRTGRRGPYATLLDFVRSGDGARTVDIQVSDDTSVDFVAMVVCEEPPREAGLTLVAVSLEANPRHKMVNLSCSGGGASQRLCNPYVGDTACGTALPVACFRDGGVPRPAWLAQAGHASGWSGGEVAFTPARKASEFRSIAEVDRSCAARFGAGWRTATFHDGGRGGSFNAYGRHSGPPQRVWIDIKGQPYATCWSR